jgi:hypothetical protein
LRLLEKHEEKVAALREQRDDAVEILKEIVAERNELLKSKMHWQGKFVSAVAKRFRVFVKRQSLLDASRPCNQSPAKANPGDPAPDPMDIDARDSIPLAHDINPVQRQNAGASRPHVVTPNGVYDVPGPAQLPNPHVAGTLPAQNPIPGITAGPDLDTLYRYLYNCEKRLDEFERRDLEKFQLTHDLAVAQEANQELQRRLDSQAYDFHYMRNTYVAFCQRVSALNHENADWRSKLEATVAENIVYAAECERVGKALISMKHQLQRATRKKAPMKQKRRVPRRGVNLRPYQAELRAYDRLSRALIQQNSVYLDNFKTANSMIREGLQDDCIAFQLATFLDNTLDRNMILERDVWNLQHPNTLDHVWLTQKSPK